MKTDIKKVTGYYEKFNEWSRLDSFLGQVEFQRTLLTVEKYLQPETKILDLGGGPGRYTIELFKKGFQPKLIDLSPALIDFARSKINEFGLEEHIEDPSVGSALNLDGIENASFDAVLALGPFYHLVDPSERSRAMQEITRVLKPGGILFVAYIPRLSGVAGLFYRAAFNPQQVKLGTMTHALNSGQFHNSSSTGFQEGIYLHPDEAVTLFTSTGLTQLSHFSLKGLFAGREEWAQKIKVESPELFQEMETLVERTSFDPAVIQCSDHALVVLRK